MLDNIFDNNVCALLIGKRYSTGYPGKNVMTINGQPSCEYGFQAAKKVGIKNIFVSTDCPEIIKIGKKYLAKTIERPAELATPDSLTEDVLVHAYNKIKESIDPPEIIVLLFANNPAISLKLIKEGVKKLKTDNTYDSAFSVCKYNMFSPTRARKIKDDTIMPFVPLELMKKIQPRRRVFL